MKSNDLSHIFPGSQRSRIPWQDQSRALPATHASWARPSLCLARAKELHWAIVRGDERDVQRLLHLGANPTPLLHTALLHKRLQIAQMLLAHGADPNVCNILGKPAIFLASDLDFVHALLAAGADVNARERACEGLTVFLNAVAQGLHPNVLRALRAAGADTSARDYWGRDALALARRLRRRMLRCQIIEELQR